MGKFAIISEEFMGKTIDSKEAAEAKAQELCVQTGKPMIVLEQKARFAAKVTVQKDDFTSKETKKGEEK